MKLFSKKTLTGTLAAMVFVLSAVFVPVTSVGAVTTQAPVDADCTTGASGGINAGVKCAQGEQVPTTSIFGTDSIFTTVVNFLLFFIGAISVIMLIWGGIRYSTSAGNSASVTAAKNTIMYAIIGLVVAFLAFAIVNWVLVAIAPTS